MGLFWGCFVALITTAFAFITRAFLVNDPNLWPKAFGLDGVQAATLFGHGIWTFAISIILFSLIIDKVGYRFAMFFSFICYGAYAALALKAYSTINPGGAALSGDELMMAQKAGLKYLTIGSMILGLGNGTVEAFINPVVATMFSKDKTKWLNILHAGWPGGLVIGGLITLGLGEKVVMDWRILVYMIALPAVAYLIMLLTAKFPVNERVASGTTYREMLAEFGVIGAAIASYLVVKQLGMVFKWDNAIVWGLIAAAVIAYGVYCRSLGRPLLILLCLIMMPLATTELGTDSAIGGIMEKPLKAAGHNPLWVLIYTSAIMFVLRFFAGPIIKKFGPIGLLAICSLLAVAGLLALSKATGLAMIFAAATLYGVGKTFFWPTILGATAEQFPKGGALTLNAISGIGMLAVGIVGGPFIGAMTAKSTEVAIKKDVPGVYEKVSKEDSYFLGKYTVVDPMKAKELPEAEMKKVEMVAEGAKQSSLASITILPTIMFIGFLLIALYFKSRGGYKAVALSDH